MRSSASHCGGTARTTASCGSPGTPCCSTASARSPTGCEVDTALLHLGGVRFPVTGPVRYSMTARQAVELCRLVRPRDGDPGALRGLVALPRGPRRRRGGVRPGARRGPGAPALAAARASRVDLAARERRPQPPRSTSAWTTPRSGGQQRLVRGVAAVERLARRRPAAGRGPRCRARPRPPPMRRPTCRPSPSRRSTYSSLSILIVMSSVMRAPYPRRARGSDAAVRAPGWAVDEECCEVVVTAADAELARRLHPHAGRGAAGRLRARTRRRSARSTAGTAPSTTSRRRASPCTPAGRW